jgi:membrane protein
MSRSTRYSLVYGSLASVIILLVWLYLCGNILILGNVANFVLYRHRQEKKRRDI